MIKEKRQLYIRTKSSQTTKTNYSKWKNYTGNMVSFDCTSVDQ